jgi:hypothetical protein
MREALLDLAPLSGSHNGKNLAAVFIAICDKFGILPKIMSITADNAPVNNVLLRSVAKACARRRIAFSKKDGHIRCAAHILNLSVQALLRQLKAEATKVEEAAEDDESGEEDEATRAAWTTRTMRTATRTTGSTRQATRKPAHLTAACRDCVD